MGATTRQEKPPVVLIIDDNLGNRELLTAQLGSEGFRALQASSGLEGIEFAQKHQPDLILLDVMMPIMNGFQVCARLKALPLTSDIPVVMVTALRNAEDRIKGIEAGADEFLSRPYNRMELLLRVRSLIQLRRMRKRLEEERNRLQLLYNVSQSIAARLDIKRIASDVLQLVQTELQAGAGYVILVNQKQAVEFSIQSTTRKSQEIRHEDLVQYGPAPWLVQNRQSVLIADTESDPRWQSMNSYDGDARSALGAPLVRAERVYGILFLTHPDPSYFEPTHLLLLDNIAAQITTAIERSRLFEQISDERSRLTAILSQTSEGIITTDEAGVVTIANAAATQMFDLQTEIGTETLHKIPKLSVLSPLLTNAETVDTRGQEITLSSGRVILATVSPIPDVGNVFVLHDITSLKQAEALRLKQERQEKELVRDTFARYLGPRLVQHVLSHEPGLLTRQERRRAIVLFADLRDSTHMMVTVAPNRAIQMLNEFFSAMSEVAHEYDGTIFDMTGDEVMVGFNAPFDQPDAAWRALQTAVVMQQRFALLRSIWQARAGLSLGLGIGIDQGMVVVGNVGAETRMTFRMVGEAVNTAHRLVEMAGDAEIIMTDSVFQAVGGEINKLAGVATFSELADIMLKGKREPTKMHRGAVLPDVDTQQAS